MENMQTDCGTNCRDGEVTRPELGPDSRRNRPVGDTIRISEGRRDREKTSSQTAAELGKETPERTTDCLSIELRKHERYTVRLPTCGHMGPA